MSKITKNDYLDWRALPVTKDYFESIQDKVKELEIRLGLGHFLDSESAEATSIAYARIVGHIEGLNDRLEIDADGLEERE